ncbi:undecaprenyldiphospho-muramoylpentapeptide beta-N-acetylglucosaminyltransferase [Tepidibacillus fermentans]|uniref:UDP-N-acetylglucosamine--N-acetylmuramyl-(pentapeptide) pyrophosphoryl-undecaprenol N-acetylglucosamine transferase n=1 Tax=Tepidibacillus fermentans TaxID=1281767 RepID=A0A4R3KKK1_9BACI|nr:undecaprenyldiphospho-muramoylpentapeptide beta-N-acetylglucosaminyltransferase [Tepidibacillus fermentans]TCS84413.1 UDP-N-acetylglucosamine-N-acetylmuramylpentapeptide N-acetylglucosamine transferase [Tepidibacillus fermentans]
MKVVLSGGGTGGHIYPALAMAKEIKKQVPNAEFLYIGSKKGLEKGIVEKAGFSFVEIEITGFKRKLSFDNVKTILRFLKGVQTSKKYLREFQPDIVIGTGGYVCGPVLYAASKEKIPTIIHEQNVIPGLTNQFLSRFVDVVAISFEGARPYFSNAKRIELTGNPRATEVVNANPMNGFQALGISPSKRIILFVGGSRGAKAINESFLEVLPSLTQYEDYHFVYVTGEVHYENIQKEIKNRGIDLNQYSNVSIFPFLYNMPEILAATSLIVSRAGASTLAEITALGVPAILIPSPYVTNNHQEKNAKWLEEQGAAKMIREKELNGQLLLETILEMMNEQNREKVVHASKMIGQPDAAGRMVSIMKTLLHTKN